MNNRFGNIISDSIRNILANARNGNFPVNYSAKSESNLLEDGVSILLGENRISASKPKERSVIALSPNASILVKKKAFSTFKHVNDLQWMDRTEKMLLRATKALFAYKVSQIRAYESLTKFEGAFEQSAEINLSLLAELLQTSRMLGIENVDTSQAEFKGLLNDLGALLSSNGYDELREDILLLLERNAFSGDSRLTTWIVDPNSTDNYETGPGTGVIEVGIFSDFSTQINLNTEPSSADFTLEDPYRIMNITEFDIEISIKEALTGSIGLLSELSNAEIPSVDGKTIAGAGLELLNLGEFDSTINTDYIRDRLRVFYLGKPFVNAGDGVHFFIRGNKTAQDFSDKEEVFDRDFLSVDETIFEAERILFTKGKLDLKTYKDIRQFSDDSFGMRHVFGGYITRISETWSNGRWVTKVNCVDNMGWLKWSRFMIEPALQDPQGILEDPLTPYEIKKDSSGKVLSASGPQLLEENKQLIKSGLLSYDSGLLNGQVATEDNLLQGQYNKSGSLSGAKIMQHPQGLTYRWKEGIITATAPISTVDPLSESEVTQSLHNQAYGLTVAEDVLNNLDLANILSILIVGQPYNVETFINQAYQVHNISRRGTSLNNTDPLSAVLDVVRRQNNHFGNFRPYRMITLSSQTMLQTANSNILRNGINKDIKKLQERRAQLDSIIRRLESNGASAISGNGILLNSLNQERISIENGIRDQIALLEESGNVSSSEIITKNFNLLGRSKTLPLTNNFTADHQVTRAMTVVGAQRRIEDVRLNRDQNLFIVSDQYDEQTDIRPFIYKLRNADYKIFKGNFVSVYDKCKVASEIINLEFFANSQGHIEFRPPQWNKTPLSVLQRLFDIGRQTDRKIVPEFLTEVFQTRSNSLKREIHTLNIRIVLIALLLNKYPDRTLIPNFSSIVSNNILLQGSGTGKASLKFFGVYEGGDDSGVDLRDGGGQVSAGNIANTGSQVYGNGLSLGAGLGAEGDILNGDTTTLLGVFDPLFQESSGLINDVLTTATSSSTENSIKIANAGNLNKLREAFIKLSGSDPASGLVGQGGKFQSSDFIFNNNSQSQNSEAENIEKANRYLKKLEDTISKRDSIVTILKRNLEKEDELDEVEDILSGEILNDTSANSNSPIGIFDRANNSIKTITDIFTGDASKGSLFDHLIADDSRNLLGPGSGKRYIIRDRDIITCTFTEEPPDFVRVDVVGDAPIVGKGLSRSFGDRYYWAGATDFDLWRQYGYKVGGTKSLPFANDAELQSKPYAILELQLQRLKINQGSITVTGNEYYEPGDVVYVESKELIYYVRSVSHSYNVGDSFTTSLTLEFGHPPGTYLPSPLDIIGQQFTKDPLVGNILTYRNSQGDDNYRALQPDSAIVFPEGEVISEDRIPVLLDHKDNSVRFTNMMADLSSILIGNRVVLIRGFVRDGEGNEDAVRNNINIIKTMLQNPVSLTQSSPTSTFDDIFDAGSDVVRGLGRKAGTTKGVSPMSLPNGLLASPIPATKIVEQIVFLDSGGNSSQIQCLNSRLQNKQSTDDKLVKIGSEDSIFPKGGPKQRTWLDLKSQNKVYSPTTFKARNVIEIGILDIERKVDTKIKKEK